MSERVKERGDRLVERLLEGGNDDAANELLSEFHAGYPIDRLRLLLRSQNDYTVKAGTWIASELGTLASPLIDDIGRLLRHPLKYVRFFAADAVLSSSTHESGQAIADAVALVDDSDEGVRWKALDFISRASTSQLTAALDHLEPGPVARNVSWLLDHSSLGTGREALAKLDGDHIDQAFAIAAAMRMGQGGRYILERATSSSDAEVRSAALEALERP